MWSPEGWEKNKDAIMTHCWPFQIWNPLHDDAQAMALVKWFGMEMSRAQTGEWFVRHFLCGSEAIINTDLNRAIVECVAKMQSAKK